MMSIALYLAGGLLLAACLLRMLFDGEQEDEFLNPMRATKEGFVAVLSDTHLSNQLFGRDDWKYVASLRSKPIERAFLRMRKNLALAWVRAAKAEAAALMSAHRAAARTSDHLDFFVELRTILAYASFLFFCSLLSLVIRIKGPVALQVLANLADSRSGRLYEIVGQVFPIAEPLDNEFSRVQPARRGRH